MRAWGYGPGTHIKYQISLMRLISWWDEARGCGAMALGLISNEINLMKAYQISLMRLISWWDEARGCGAMALGLISNEINLMKA